MNKLILLFLLISIFAIFIVFYKNYALSCLVDQNFCAEDSDCMCSTDPCFLGNKEYYNKCFLPQQKGVIQVCPDACGFGPEEIEFRTICENNQCKLATFNKTIRGRIS